VVLVDVAGQSFSGPGGASAEVPGPRASPARTVREAFPHPQDLTAELTAGRIGVLCHLSTDSRLPGTVRPDGPDGLAGRCQGLVAALRLRHGAAARIGIGEPATRLAELHESYLDAAAALRLGPALGPTDRSVFPIATLRPHQLLASAGPHARARFEAVVLAELRGEPDWPVLRDTLVAWAECGFNLVRAAARLHIHRNTLIYRLDKISQRCGRSARDPEQGLALYLASLTAQLDGITASTRS
jgi:carbohydrate diacid regulator